MVKGYIENYYKKYCSDLFGFAGYLLKKLCEHHLIIFVTIALYFISRYYIYSYMGKDQFAYVDGVSMSILAATVFEGYRGYKKEKGENKIVKFCINKILNQLEVVEKGLKSSLITIHFEYLPTLSKEPVLKETFNLPTREFFMYLRKCVNNRDNFNRTIPVPIDFNKSYFEYDFDKEDYEDELRFYNLFKTLYSKNMCDSLNWLTDIIISRCDDVELIETFIQYRDNVNAISRDNRFPDELVALSMPIFYTSIISVIDATIILLDKVNDYM